MDLPDEIIKDLDRKLGVTEPEGLTWYKDNNGRWIAGVFDLVDGNEHNYTIVKAKTGYVVAEIKTSSYGMGGNRQ